MSLQSSISSKWVDLKITTLFRLPCNVPDPYEHETPPQRYVSHPQCGPQITNADAMPDGGHVRRTTTICPLADHPAAKPILEMAFWGWDDGDGWGGGGPSDSATRRSGEQSAIETGNSINLPNRHGF